MGQQQQRDTVFRKEITEARLNPRSPVSIPGGALELLPPFVAQGLPIEVEASDFNGAVHSFTFKRRWIPEDMYPKPTIPESCWKAFVTIKRLIPGDWIILYRIRNGAIDSYEVRCERLYNLFGKDLWLDVEKFAN